MADNLNYFSDEEEPEWLASIDPSLLDKSNEEEQLDKSEISSFIEENRNSNTTKKTKTDLNGSPSTRGTEQSPCPFFLSKSESSKEISSNQEL